MARDPIGQLAHVYRTLNLPDFEYARPKVAAYVAGLSGYKKNSFAPLPPQDRDRIAAAWSRSFDEWGYSKAGPSP